MAIHSTNKQPCSWAARWLTFLLGMALGAGLAYGIYARVFPPDPPAPIVPGAKLELTIWDAETSHPVTATITFRRETPTGEPIPPLDGDTYEAQHIFVDVPVDGNVLWLLVEAEGYHDWELALQMKKPGQVVQAPIRLKPLWMRPNHGQQWAPLRLR